MMFRIPILAAAIALSPLAARAQAPQQFDPQFCQAALDALSNQRNNANNEAATLQANLQIAKGAVERLTKDKDGLAKQITDLQKQVADLNTQLVAAKAAQTKPEAATEPKK